jgi:hypothetical protein
MCSSWCGVGVVRWRHAASIEGLHRHRRIAVEAIEVLHRGMMVRIIASVVVPASVVVIVSFVVVMLLVVHLQLAHSRGNGL